MTRWTRLLMLAVVAAATLWACSDTTENGAASGANAEEWAWLQQAKIELDDLRAEVAQLDAEIAAAPAEDEAATEEEAGEDAAEEGAEPAADPAAELAQAKARLDTLTEEYNNRLATYINNLGLIQGQERTPEQVAAIRMKTDEDIVLAQEWIEKGGDWARALDIYRAALPLDPDNEKLQAAIEHAEEMRFMTEERFAQVQEDMTQDEVKALLGPVNIRNIKEFPEKKVIGWFYRKDNGGAAAVYFRLDKKTDLWISYDADFEAIKPQVIGPDGQAEDAETEEASE